MTAPPASPWLVAPTDEEQDGQAWLPWLVRLRWAAAAGQLITVAAARLAFEIGRAHV